MIFEFICACEQPFPGRTLPRSVPTKEILDEWCAEFPQFKHELIEWATDLAIDDIRQKNTPEVKLSEEELDEWVKRGMDIVKPMIDKAFEERRRLRAYSQESTPEPSDS